MDEKKIARINELYHKSKKEGLTEQEKKEQQVLRKEYIMAIRASVRNTLDNASIEEADGTIVPLKEKRRKNQKGKPDVRIIR
ncbi:MAG: DUF896 domain-containing protein [Lachnospiraceae bacterium]|nr:DUF896 domain-containing protein [Lachnospiraceae bacterium]